MKTPNFRTDLQLPDWAVVENKKVIALDLNYQAALDVKEENKHKFGVAIVPNKVALDATKYIQLCH